jgi:serine/threonine-protein kinase
MSSVYLAEEIVSKKEYALKILENETISNRIEDIIRFRYEGDLITKLEHPHIVKLYEIGEYNNLHFIVMEYMHGKSLYQYVTENSLINEKIIISLISQIGQALEYIHGKNIIHRDSTKEADSA